MSVQLCVERFKSLREEAQQMPGGEGLAEMFSKNVDYAQAHLDGKASILLLLLSASWGLRPRSFKCWNPAAQPFAIKPDCWAIFTSLLFPQGQEVMC